MESSWRRRRCDGFWVTSSDRTHLPAAVNHPQLQPIRRPLHTGSLSETNHFVFYWLTALFDNPYNYLTDNLLHNDTKNEWSQVSAVFFCSSSSSGIFLHGQTCCWFCLASWLQLRYFKSCESPTKPGTQTAALMATGSVVPSVCFNKSGKVSLGKATIVFSTAAAWKDHYFQRTTQHRGEGVAEPWMCPAGPSRPTTGAAAKPLLLSWRSRRCRLFCFSLFIFVWVTEKKILIKRFLNWTYDATFPSLVSDFLPFQ